MRVLDAGCGTGEVLRLLRENVGPDGEVVGMDLAAAHAAAARREATGTLVLQADLSRAPFQPRSFDLIWSVNTINHLREPAIGLRTLASLLRPGGRLVFGQSSLLPDMYFAWDSRLERAASDAVRQYFQERYRIDEGELSGVRSLLGWALRASLQEVTVRTLVIERVFPMRQSDEAYLLEAIFGGFWGERLRPYLSSSDYAQLGRLCDPQDPQFALRRPDFHFLQTLTLVTGRA
jgi:SAM-dependent methyltransferase